MKVIPVFLSMPAVLVSLCLASGTESGQAKPMPNKRPTLQQGSPAKQEVNRQIPSPSSRSVSPSPGSGSAVENRTPYKPSTGPAPTYTSPGPSGSQHSYTPSTGGGYNDRRGDNGHWRGEPTNPWRRWNRGGYWDYWPSPGPIYAPYPVLVPYSSFHRLAHGVYLRVTSDDAVGSDLAYALNDHLRAVGLIPVASIDEATLELYVVSTDEDPVHPGSASAVSISYIWFPGYRFVTSQVLNVWDNQVDDLAGSVATYAGQLIGQYD